MEKPLIERLKQRIREHGEIYKVNQLCIDQLPIGQLTPDLTKQLQKCVNIQYITFEKCQLKSLENFPRFPKLQSLQLGSNKITGQLNVLAKYNNLRNLNLSNNKIISAQSLKQLLPCKQLTKLLLSGNPLCRQNYRAQIFSLIPQVQIIDGIDRLGKNIKQQSSSSGSSQYSESEIGESDNEQERQSPTKVKRKN